LVLSIATPAFTHATILYAHGSKDPAWIGTIERMAHELLANEGLKNTHPAHHVSTAYVEHAQPTPALSLLQ
jgi:sirohydrochlorin ferrochelatase